MPEESPKNFRRFFFLFFGLSFRNCKSCVYKDDHPSFNSSLRDSHIWFSYHSKFQPCFCWKVSPWGVQAKTPWWQQHKAMPRGRRIAYKLHVITENIKHDDSLSKEGGKPKTGLNCLYNFNNEKRHYKYKASYQIGTKSTTSEARKRKEQRRWKGEKRKLTACENTRKRACPVFHTLGGVPLAKDFEPNIFGILQLETVDCETLHLRDLCRANCFAREAQFGTSAPEGEWTYNCLKRQYLSTNGLFGTSYVIEFGLVTVVMDTIG